MKKVLLIPLFISAIILLSSCIRYDNSGSLADDHFEQLLDAIGKNDADAVNKLFSEKAKAEAEGHEANIEVLFEFVQGNVISWNRLWRHGSKTSTYGIQSNLVRTMYEVKTDVDEYMLYIYDYVRDDTDPTNQGIYYLRVFKAEDRDLYYKSTEGSIVPGIYIPPEYFDTEIE